MIEEERIERAKNISSSIFGDELPTFCRELSSNLEKYRIAKGLHGDTILDVDDFFRWLEANKYDWMDRVDVE